MSNVIDLVLSDSRKIKHLFIYESYEFLNNVKIESLKNLSKQNIKFKDLGSRVIMDDRIIDFSFDGDNYNKLIGNRYRVINVYAKLSVGNKKFVESLLEDVSTSNIMYLGRNNK